MLDIAIRGGNVVDGTGLPAARLDVGIEAGRIAAIGDLSAAAAARTVDASGLIVAPGFIDTHTHSEGALLVDPQHDYGLRQGITTEIFGLDGVSYAPLSRTNYLAYRRYLAGLLGDPPVDLDTSSVASFRAAYHRRVAVNTAYLVPHGAIRLEALGFRDEPLTGPALDRARRMVREAMEQGAVGLSSGLNYYPCAWCDTDELVELAKATGEAGGIHVIELRYQGSGRAFGDGGVGEAMEVGRRSGAPIHLAHYRTQPDTAGDVDGLMGPVDRAKAAGVDCTFDIYPYPTGSSQPISFLPGWAQEGGPDAILERLADDRTRGRLARYLDTEHDARGAIPIGSVVFSFVSGAPQLEGTSLRDVARERGLSPGEALCDVLLAADLRVGYCIATPTSMARWRQVSRDSLALLAREDAMACSDITPMGSVCHPRTYGAYPRFLGRLRREFGGLSLETMIQRMTDAPARRFGLSKRGRIEVGYHADVVVFDADRIIDTATYDDPRQHPAGIPYVLVNGGLAVDGERPTGLLAGEAVP